jgi:hypothetical protein
MWRSIYELKLFKVNRRSANGKLYFDRNISFSSFIVVMKNGEVIVDRLHLAAQLNVACSERLPKT